MLNTENGIFWTTSPESIAANVAPAISVASITSSTTVPMLAGRKSLSATAAA